jgi:hypothetical protein
MQSFKEVTETAPGSFAVCPLGRAAMEMDFNKDISAYDYSVGLEVEEAEPIKNKIDGLRREAEVENDLRDLYPENEGYTLLSETYLRDADGNIAKDPVTGEARRLDFVVTDKDGSVIDSFEVTSETADKTEQSAKEFRIRNNGGEYIKVPDGNLVHFPSNIETTIERRA